MYLACGVIWNRVKSTVQRKDTNGPASVDCMEAVEDDCWNSPSVRCPSCGLSFLNRAQLTIHERVGCYESDNLEEEEHEVAANITGPLFVNSPEGAVAAPARMAVAQHGLVDDRAAEIEKVVPPGGAAGGGRQAVAPPPMVPKQLRQRSNFDGTSDASGDGDSPAQGAEQLRAKQLQRDAQGERHAYFHRMALLRSSDCKVHPLKRFGGIVNFEQLKASLTKSQVDFDRDSSKLNLNFAPRPGRGDLTVMKHDKANELLRAYAATLGLQLQPRKIEFDDGKGGKRQLPGFFAPWRALVKYAAENPFYFCEQRVYTSRTRGEGSTEQVRPAVALRTEKGERYYSHATDSDAYIKAVEEERTRRVELQVDPKDVGHLHTLKPWAVYTFILFQDAAAEPDGESFMMWHAVSAHIPLEEQSKPRAWLTIGIAAKLSFETPTIAALQESVTLRANCEAAYDDAVLGELFRIGAGGVAVRQRWDADVEMPTTVVAGVHALVLDNPQQAAVLGVTGCPYCIQSNRRRAFFGRAPDTRSKANMQPVLMAAHDTMQNARGPRDLEMRVAKKNLARLGLRWPPKPPVTYLSYLQIQPYHVSAYLNLHNLGLCMRPNTAQLIMQFLFDEMGGQRAFDAWLARANVFVKQHVVKGWNCVLGRCRRKGLGGVLRKATGAPTVRSKSKYDVANAFKFFALVVHEPLLSIARAAASEEEAATNDDEVNEARQRGNRAKLAIKALHLIGEFANITKQTMISESTTRRMHQIAKELMPVMRTAFEGRKNFHLSNNWHKLSHVAQLVRWLGPLMGGTNDEHAEMCQKLLHIAYQHHANKTSDAIEQIADYLSRLAAMKHAERWLVLSNADLVRSAELGIHANVVYLLENGVVDALGVDDVTGRCPADDALAAACRRGDADTAILLLRACASASGCTAERCAHLITAARSPAREGAIATVGMLLRARAQASASWSSLSAAEWADREGNSALALILEAAGVRRRCQPPPTPTPRKDPTKNRLLPRPRSRKGKHQLLDLASLRPGATEGKNLRACPPLRLLEGALRVFCNGGDEDVPMALAGTTVVANIRMKLEVTVPTNPTNHPCCIDDIAHAVGKVVRFTLNCWLADCLDSHKSWEVSSQQTFDRAAATAAAAAATAALLVNVDVLFEQRGLLPALVTKAATRLSKRLTDSLPALTQAFRESVATPEQLEPRGAGSSGDNGSGGHAVWSLLALSSATRICDPPQPAMSHVPMLPPESMASVDLRPGMLFKEPSSAGGYGGDDEAEMGFSVARLLQLKRKARPAYDASSGHQGAAWREFVSVQHNDSTYDAFGFLGELIFTFRFKLPDGEHADLALVRWMDDAPNEEIGQLFVNEDEDEVESADDAWSRMEARMREPKSKRSRRVSSGVDEDEDEDDEEGDEDKDDEEEADAEHDVEDGNDDDDEDEGEDEDEDEDEGEGEGEGEDEDEDENGNGNGDEEDEDEDKEKDEEHEEHEDEDKDEDGNGDGDIEDEEEEGEEEEKGEDQLDAIRQRGIPGGVPFRRYVYAVRTQTQGAAKAHYAKAWYGVVQLDHIRCAVPLSQPHFSTEDEQQSWESNLEKVVYSKQGRTKEVNLKATLDKRSSFIYDHHRVGS